MSIPEQVNVIILNEIKYANTTHFNEFISPKVLKKIRKQVKSASISNWKECHIIHVECFNLNIEWDLIVGDSCEWNDVKNQAINNLRRVADEIDDVAFNYTPIWCPEGPESESLDTRPTAKSPYEALPDGAILHINIIHRKNIGWKPLIQCMRRT